MKHFMIYYNDGVYAETVTFVNRSRKFIKRYLTTRIKQYNINPNKKYHINFKNIKRSL
jgi:hypothetical protein